MILAIDIGNSNINVGGFDDGELSFVVRMATDVTRTEDEYAGSIMSTLALHRVDGSRVSGAIISSVVPPLNTVMRQAIKKVYGVEPLLVGPGIKTGLAVRCDNPTSVGADLICACVCAQSLYGTPSLIIDVGTATKMMVVDELGAFVGVSIIPGVMMGLNALSDGTAQLPKISLDAPKQVIGKNTVDCMKSGVIFGNASMLDGMIDRINEEMGSELPVYITGGLAPVILPYCKHKMTFDEHLVLKGLYILYNKNR